jgi:hypothetical protein
MVYLAFSTVNYSIPQTIWVFNFFPSFNNNLIWKYPIIRFIDKVKQSCLVNGDANSRKFVVKIIECDKFTEEMYEILYITLTSNWLNQIGWKHTIKKEQQDE